MTVSVGDFGRLTPKQILLDALNESDDIDCVVILSKLGRRYVLSNSDGDIVEMLGMLEIGKDSLLERLRDD